MARARNLNFLWEWRLWLLPALLSAFLFCASTAVFLYRYRNDLLILSAQNRNLNSVVLFTRLGASAAAATSIFPEPALIEYLLALQAPLSPVTEGSRIAALLLKAGASVNERNAGGWTPLMLAAAAGQEGISQLLVQNGADINARGFGGEQTEGITALMTAAMHGHLPIVNFLLEKGANVHFRSRSGFTALLLAASRGHLNCIDALLEKGAAVPLSTVQVAERNGHQAVALRLRKAFENPRTESFIRRPARLPEE